jgi:perosamine synthetase
MESMSYVPALPTLWPRMLLGRHTPGPYLPFSSVRARYFYFARNAVWTAVKMLGLEGAEVLVPAYHHGVEVEALIDAGARPVFFRVDSRWQPDLFEVERLITPRTRALYLIHYAGFPGPAEQLRALCDRRGLILIEDCALSLLSDVGQHGDVSIFCLYKTLPVPNGGALVVNGERAYSLPEPPPPPLASTLSHTASALLANLELRGGRVGRGLRSAVRSLARGTVSAAGVKRVATGTQHFNRDHVDLGMSPLTRRIAEAQDLRAIVEARRRNYFYLLGQLREVATPWFNGLPPGACPLFYPLRVEDKTAVQEALRARGIEAIDFWRHSHPACDLSRFPEVAQLRRSVLEIPCHQDLDLETLHGVARTVRQVVGAPRREVA